MMACVYLLLCLIFCLFLNVKFFFCCDLKCEFYYYRVCIGYLISCEWLFLPSLLVFHCLVLCF
jgi:hypothetical protein